jgi:hypothetical protein
MPPHDARMIARFASAGTAAMLCFFASICGGNAKTMVAAATLCPPTLQGVSRWRRASSQRSGVLRRAADGVRCDSCAASLSLKTLTLAVVERAHATMQ